MPSLRILSWNIQKFGEDKRTDQDVINFIYQVIKLANADVVGLMELVGWQGNETRDTLVANLNNWETLNKTGVVWAGQASEMTPSRPNEQYVFLWKTNVLQNTQWMLWNVVGESVFDQFFAKHGLDAAWQENFWKSLFNNGWLDAAFMLPWQKRDLLQINYKNLDLTKKAPILNLTDPQKQEVVQVLVAEPPVTFPVRGSRPPFVLKGQTAGGINVIFVLFHAPGPDSGLPIIASNQLNFLEPVQTAGVCVVMGDFNVGASECAKTYVLQYFDLTTGKLGYVRDAGGAYLYGSPFQRLTGPAFLSVAQNPALSKVENYGKRLWTDKTSISTTLAQAGKVADANAVQAILSSEYDKFFVRSPYADPSAPSVIPAIDALVPKSIVVGVGPFGPVTQTTSTTTTTYQAALAVSAKNAYNKWWDRQNAKKNKSKATIKLLADMPKLANAPSSLREAQYTYRYAISDHMPIVMELRYA